MYSGEHLLWVGMAQTTLVGARYGRAEGGKEDDVVGILLEDALQSSWHLGHHGGK